MKDEFFAFTLTGVGALFAAGGLFVAILGSLFKGDWETATVLAVICLLMLSAARSDARSEIREGIYRGRLLHVREGSVGFSYSKKGEAKEVLHGEVLQ